MLLKDSDWWRSSTIYSVWPYSFKDTTGKGTGDIKGIISKLGHIKALGVDIIWVSPIFCSPMVDKGYDVSDYYNINPRFGSNQDAKDLIDEVHKRGMKIIFDLVVNHTSDQHKWFQEAKKDKNSKYRNYYIFHKGVNGKEPNQWRAQFAGNCWTYNPDTNDYYLHNYTKHQPDINWDCPELREEIFNIARYWMNKGIDGWRLDAICCMTKPVDIKTGEIDLTYPMPYVVGERLHGYLKMLCDVFREKDNVLIIGEIGVDVGKELWKFTDPGRGECNATIVFDMVSVDVDASKGIGKFALQEFKVDNVRKVLDYWNDNISNGCLCLHTESMDQPRVISRWGNEDARVLSGKLLAIFNHSMKGLPIIYQGEEIGMMNWKFTFEQINDIEILQNYQELVVERKIYTKEKFMDIAKYISRDSARTPMQWDSSPNAGFTTGDPWLPVNQNYYNVNAKAERKDPNSIFHFYSRLVNLRKKEPLLVNGELFITMKNSSYTLGFLRKDQNVKLLVICHFSSDTEEVCHDDIDFDFHKLFEFVIGNYDSLFSTDCKLVLRPYEAFILKQSG